MEERIMATLHFTVTGPDGKRYKEKAMTYDRTPNPGTARSKHKDIRSEVNAKYLSGRQHGKSVATGKRFNTALNHLSIIMKKYYGTTELKGVSKPNFDKFVERLKTQP